MAAPTATIRATDRSTSTRRKSLFLPSHIRWTVVVEGRPRAGVGGRVREQVPLGRCR